MAQLKKLNGLAKWIIVALAVGTIGYNTIVTHVILKNDVKHLAESVNKIEKRTATIEGWIFDQAKK